MFSENERLQSVRQNKHTTPPNPQKLPSRKKNASYNHIDSSIFNLNKILFIKIAGNNCDLRMYLASVQEARHKQHQQQKKKKKERKANVALKLNEVNFFNIIFSAHSAFINCLMLCRLPQFLFNFEKTTAERNVATAMECENTTHSISWVVRMAKAL